MNVTRCTPVMIVDVIEPVLDLWEGRLGFQRTIEVPYGSQLGFVALRRDGVELMFQTKASLADDLPAVLERMGERETVLYMEVSNLEAALKTLVGWELIVPEREAFYGAREVVIEDPAGYMVTVAERSGDGSPHGS